MLGSLQSHARSFICAKRRSVAVKVLHRVTSFVEAAYSNVGASFEANGERSLLQNLRPAEFRVVLDVGANFGDWSAEALAVWPNCHIHGFEVAPRTFERLSARFRELDTKARASLSCLGLSDESGAYEMLYYPDHPELTCDTPRHAGYTAIPEGVPVIVAG